MNIRVGQIIKVIHNDDNGMKSRHPYIVIDISKKNIYGIQCSSVKVKDGASYFSRNNIPYYEFKFSSLKYVTHVRLNLFTKMTDMKILSVMCMPNIDEFSAICNYLFSCTWENTELFNDNEIKGHIANGMCNFGLLWEIE